LRSDGNIHFRSRAIEYDVSRGVPAGGKVH
jgi:hypothetical protein